MQQQQHRVGGRCDCESGNHHWYHIPTSRGPNSQPVSQHHPILLARVGRPSQLAGV